ncbi:glycosyltransferase [Paraclostridium sp. AKS73]|uniref:glycosyltransferase n=1 Tax=Paraclostridium sp. AKS73 TaxID=2876116 RepID=UPI0021E07E8B|nr:glycosyltransferase [Paraclostridium sp. AKS73]MCU9816209.1 glycosyltransferase [Paraclostridium sp. AKS73]
MLFVHNTPKTSDNLKKSKEKLERKKRIFYGGILSDNRMIEETMKICSRNQDWELIVAGFGPIEEKCKKYDENFSNIKFIGKLAYKDIIQNTINSDVVFACYDPSVPNHRYSSPNKLYEAMMCKKPIIVCENTGIDKIIVEENIGLSCEFNEKSLENAFKTLLEDEEIYNIMASNSRKLYETKYKWEIMEKRLSDMYENIKIDLD